SRKQKAEEEEEADEYIEDDEERQKRIKQFWGEQRNLRRTRLKEILKGLQELGLKRHFRPIAEDGEESGALLTGLAAVLKQAPVDVAAWQQAVSVVASLPSSDALHGQTAMAQRSWQLANAGFFRLNAQVVQLRSATFAEHSTEVNAQQVQHITGLAESLAHTVAKDRRVAAELLASATAWMHSAVAWCAPTTAGESVDTVLLKQLADQLALLLAQLLAAVRHIADAGGWAARAPVVEQAAAGFQIAAAELTKANAALAVAHSALVALQLSGVSIADAARHMALFEHSVTAKNAVHRAVLAVREALVSAAALDLPPMLLDPWAGPVSTLVTRITELFEVSTMDSDTMESRESAVALAELAGQWATAVMNSWQTIHHAEKQFEAEPMELNMWGLSSKELIRRIDLMQQMSRALHLPTMLHLCQRLTQLASAPGVPQDLVTGFVRPWINRYSLMVQHVVVLYAGLHKTVVQFALTVTAVLTTVIVHGLGTNDIYDSEDTDESNASGTGIGEGSTAGAKNVSDEIEGEDQVEGVQGEEAHDNEDPGNNEDAIDMENDFAGQLGDADLETDNDDSDDSSDDEENEMDEQMGDVDPTDPTALDEKLWDDEEEDEPEDNKGEDSKVDSKASKKKEKSDIVAGDDDDKDDGS
ncbi:AAA ATPase midasin, partial [Coemansia sp. RSA 2673]